jgi:hypothetical protein
MIAADHIAIDGDTAWWIPHPKPGVPSGMKPHVVNLLNRPCDTCFDEVWHAGMSEPFEDCPDCDGTGRLTFT